MRTGSWDVEFPFIAGFVRLSFQDCAGNGRCNGCIDHNLEANKGLKRYTNALDHLFDTDAAVNCVLSRADYYILASYVALERGTEHAANSFSWSKNFRAGRTVHSRQ